MSKLAQGVVVVTIHGLGNSSAIAHLHDKWYGRNREIPVGSIDGTLICRLTEVDAMDPKAMVLPKENYIVIEFRQRDLPGFATVNTGLKEFQAKSDFPWHLSLLINCVDLVENRLPSQEEQKCLYEFEDKLDRLLKTNVNSLFLARVTHNARRELIWRVHNPEVANTIIQNILRTKDYPREFDYRMDNDPAWEKSSWYLKGSTTV